MTLVLAPFLKSKEPPSERLWRYMSLRKFVSMLSTGQLYFARLDQFRDWRDGDVPAPMMEEAGPSTPSEFEFDGFRPLRGMGWILEECRRARTRVAASCWVAAEHEIDGQWTAYAGIEGVAIRTSWGSFERALSRSERQVMGGPMTYTADESVND